MIFNYFLCSFCLLLVFTPEIFKFSSSSWTKILKSFSLVLVFEPKVQRVLV